MARVVVDLGGCFVRAGVASDAAASTSGGGPPAPRLVVPNMSAKVKGSRAAVIADEVASVPDVSSLVIRRPFDKGYLVNAELESQILDRVFGDRRLGVGSTKGASLLCTEPAFALPAIQHTLNELAFEKYGFDRLLAVPAPYLTARACAFGARPAAVREVVARGGAACADSLEAARRASCGVVVDAGFSFSHAVPFVDGKMALAGVRRLNFGGKAMTNLLKEVVSYRAINMMDETYIIDDIKEKMCFVAQDFEAAGAEARKGVRSEHYGEYVLPDGVRCARGYVRAKRGAAGGSEEEEDDDEDEEDGAGPSAVEEQYLPICNERFMTPEVLFHPSDIGINQAGLPELVTQAVDALRSPALDPGLLYANVVLSGGCVNIPGFVDRFAAELRKLVPDSLDLNLALPDDPQTCAFAGGVALARSDAFERMACTRAEYEEHGGDRLRRPQLSLIHV